MNQIRKNVLITGASRGIGRATAIEFSKNGFNVIIHYNQNKLEAHKTLGMLDEGNHFVIDADLSKPEKVEKLVENVYEKYGLIGILVNNAGIYLPNKFEDLSFDTWQKDWRETIETNLTGVGNLSFLVAKKMIQQKVKGRIINVSSRGAFRGEPEAISYGASKAGLNALGQSMAKALGEFGVSVYTVAPGFVATEMSDYIMSTAEGKHINAQSPLNRIAEPEEVAETILFCATTKADFLTGGIIDINGASYLRS